MKYFVASAALFAMLAGAVSPAAAAQTCKEPNKPANVTSVPDIGYPPVRQGPVNGTVVLRVDLNAKGELIGHEFLERTHNSNLDLEVLQAAHRVKYTPEIMNCHPVGGSYLFIVEFPAEH